MRIGITIISLLLMFLSLGLQGQSKVRVSVSGIVVDSVSLIALPNVHIKAKRSGVGVTASPSGQFTIAAPLYDTLVFTSIGYKLLEYPVLMNEEDILIRLQEFIVMLPEVTTIGTRLSEKKYGERRPVIMPAPTIAEGIFSPFTFFSKTEKEKRKLVKVQEENAKIRTYVEVVNDPDLKKDIMNEFSITEAEFYELLVKFNVEKRYVHYLVSEEQIRGILSFYIKKELSAKVHE
jgi:hypothetical protein